MCRATGCAHCSLQGHGRIVDLSSCEKWSLVVETELVMVSAMFSRNPAFMSRMMGIPLPVGKPVTLLTALVHSSSLKVGHIPNFKVDFGLGCVTDS